MPYFDALLASGTLPIITAFLLGIFVSVHPCPLTLNITAIGYIANDIENKKAVLTTGLMYTAGRIFTYTLLTFIIYLGADALNISSFFLQYIEKFIGPFLIIIGILMLDLIPWGFSFSEKLKSFFGKRIKNKKSGAFLLGSVFSLAFCPHTAILYFGILLPLTMTVSGGFLLPVSFAVGTGLPVVLVALILTYSLANISSFFNNLKIIEKWIRIITAIIFIFVGIFFTFFAFESFHTCHAH